MAARDEPLDPSLISKFTDLDKVDEQLVPIFMKKHPGMKGMIIDSDVDDEKNEVHFEITILTAEDEVIVYRSTVPTFRVKPLNPQST